MAKLDAAILDFRRLDRLAGGDSAVHRLDARAKVLATMAYLVAIASFDRYQVSALVPFLAFPAVVAAQGGIPGGFVARKAALVLPFALMVGVLNPLFDRAAAFSVGPVAVSAGWISCASILLRAALSAAGAIVLVSVTGFPAVCGALERLRFPKPFVTQLLFLHRYLLVLAEDGARAARAREMRSFEGRGAQIRPWASLVGHLLLRTFSRAERIHRAMLSRGFTGEFPARAGSRFGASEAAFLGGWTMLFLLLRTLPLPRMLGSLVTGGLR